MALPKPRGLAPEYGAQFQDASIVSAYSLRPPYPAETFAILNGLIADEPRAVLDAGCGRGELARYLLPFVDRVDAVDISAGMIAAGKRLPGGDDPRLRWVVAPLEEAELQPPYALITAGASIHWMDWYVVLPRFAGALTPRGTLALLYQQLPPYPWDREQGRIIGRYSTNREFQPYDIVAELEKRGLFEKHGEQVTDPVPLIETVEEYVAAMHSMNGFSRERMTPEAAAAFDQEMRELLLPFASDGILDLQVSARVTWGKPPAPQA